MQPVGEHLKYMVYVEAGPIACLAWSSAPRHLGSRDRFIDWPPKAPTSPPQGPLALLDWTPVNTSSNAAEYGAA